MSGPRLVALLTALGCGAAPARAVLSPCPGAAAERVACGSLEVPEDPRRPQGRAIRLRFVVLRALEPAAGGPPPLFHLEGGPGVPATGALPFYLGPGTAYRRHRDVVLLDQRGSGESSPLHCPEIEARSALVEQYSAADVDACRARLAARADLGLYGTAIAAADLDRVRAALGYERIDLWALSYGTQLAQVYLRELPGRVRRAVLVGVAPLDLRTPLHHAENARRVIDRLVEQCAADAACRAAYPDLRASVAAVVVDGPFGEAVRRLLGTAAAQRRLPFLIDRAAHGDRAPLQAELEALRDPTAEGMYLSIACAEGTLFIEEATGYRVENQLAACRRWPVERVDRAFFAPVRSTAEVLVLSGGMDATTPPAYAEAVCTMLGNCRLISFPLLGHGPFDLDAWEGGDCFDRVALEFLETGRVDATCVGRMKPPPFYVP